MATENVQSALLEAEALLSSEDAASLSSRIFYVRSRQEPSRAASGLEMMAAVLAPRGDNDSVVLTRNQLVSRFAGLARFGTDLGVIDDLGHMELFVVGAEGAQTRAGIIHAFTDWTASDALPVPGSLAKRLGCAKALSIKSAS